MNGSPRKTRREPGQLALRLQIWNSNQGTTERRTGLLGLCRSQTIKVGTARCAVPVAERSVRRLKKRPFAMFVPSFRTGTPKRGIPTTSKVCQRHNSKACPELWFWHSVSRMRPGQSWRDGSLQHGCNIKIASSRHQPDTSSFTDNRIATNDDGI